MKTLLGILLLFLVACSSTKAKKEHPLAFLGSELGIEHPCSDSSSERSPSSVCSADASSAKNPLEGLFKKYETQLEQSDISRGEGLANASVYVSQSSHPVRQGSPDSSFWMPNQVVNFYQPLDSRGRKNASGVAVRGTPTRVYLAEDGDVAYLAFDQQAISFYEFKSDPKLSSYKVIPGHGYRRHPAGFSAPVGQIKKLANPISEYTVDELRVLVGREGQEVNLEFESGVIVRGIVEKYTSLAAGDDGRAVVVTFKDKTCTVTYGVHTLFTPDQGVYDMLIMPSIRDSGAQLAPGS